MPLTKATKSGNKTTQLLSIIKYTALQGKLENINACWKINQ